MITKEQATHIVQEAFPTWEIQASVDYQMFYIFMVFSDQPGEEEYDPFYSVNKDTGELLDFSIIEDGNPEEISNLFLAAQGESP